MAEGVVLPGGVLVDRAVVVHSGLDPGLAQTVRHPAAVLEAGREQVINARGLRALLHDHGALGQQLPIVRGTGAPGLVPLVQVLELDAQHRGLKTVEPLVEAELDVLALDALAEVAQTTQPAGQQCVVCAHRSSVPERAQVLPRVKRKARGRPERADHAASVAGAGGLRSVLQDQEPMRPGDGVQRVHVAGLAVEMDGEDADGARADGGAGRLGIDQARALQHLAQHRRGADVRDGQSRGDERVGRDDDLVTRADVVGPQHERQRRGPGGDADALLDAAVLGKFVFKRLNLSAQDVRARIEHASERVVQALLDRSVLEIESSEAHGLSLAGHCCS